ncbi:hypothetical protein, partial [Akkermansia sp.]|uniref:hypothetical protein n=1 Tax=Akkermansia sp. TaxID=1872421 RepID=UPI003A878614
GFEKTGGAGNIHIPGNNGTGKGKIWNENDSLLIFKGIFETCRDHECYKTCFAGRDGCLLSVGFGGKQGYHGTGYGQCG